MALTDDLSSRRWIVAKGLLFLVLAVSCAALLVARAPQIETVVLVLVLAWSAARFYYFLFYVLERYVDPSLKYAGVGALVSALVARRRT